MCTFLIPVPCFTSTGYITHLPVLKTFMYSFGKYLPSTYHVPGTVLITAYKLMNKKMMRVPALKEFKFWWEEAIQEVNK